MKELHADQKRIEDGVTIADMRHFVQENQAPLLFSQKPKGGFRQQQMDTPEPEHGRAANIRQ